MRKFLLFIFTAGILVAFGFVLARHAFGREPAIKVACVGDSITAGSGLDDPSTESYPAQLKGLLGDRYEVSNFGLSGRTCLNGNDRSYMSEDRYLQALEYEPDIVTIKLGTNDSKAIYWSGRENFENDLGLMVDSFYYLPGSPKVFLCLPAPAFSDIWGIDSLVIVNEVIPSIRNVARNKGVPVIDLNTPLRNEPGHFPDGVHPNTEGAARIARIIANAITPVEE